MENSFLRSIKKTIDNILFKPLLISILVGIFLSLLVFIIDYSTLSNKAEAELNYYTTKVSEGTIDLL